MKRTILYTVLALLILGLPHAVPASVDGPVILLVDGKRLPTSPHPVLRGGRVYVPVTVFRSIGLGVSIESGREATVGWPESDLIIDFQAGVSYYTWDAPEPVRVNLPGTPFIHMGVLMVPLKALLSDRDYGTSLTAEWNPRSRTVSLHRSRSWLRWRFADDDGYVENQPDLYSHVFLGNYVPVIPSREIQRAEKLDASGEWFDAAKVLHAVVWSRPFTWDPEPGRVWDEWRAYEPLGRMLVRERPEGANGHYYLGIGLAVEGDFAAAEQEFRRSAELDPSKADYHFAAGWAVLRQEKVAGAMERSPDTLRKALAEFDRALEADPNHVLSLRTSGYAWLSLAYGESLRAGYTDQVREQVRPYLENAASHFERLLVAAGPSPGISYLVGTIRDQLN